VNADRPARIAIIGGGCAGITAAFELSRPKHRGRFEVTVYQQGFRLGGKGASGRGPADRIEEHGLHLWMGFYENAFRIMRDCYAELGRDPADCRIATWQDAFVPDHFCGVMDRSPNGRWSPWTVAFPPTPGLPGDEEGPPRWSIADYLQRSVVLALTLLETIRSGVAGESAASDARAAAPAGMAAGDLSAMMDRLMSYGGLAGLGGLIEGLRVLDQVVRFMPSFPRDAILRFHEALAASARAEIERITANNDGLRRLWEVVELVLATIRGIVRFGLVTDPRGFSAIDEYDCREWLIMNGASERAANSAFLRALYDLAFAYEDGDVHRPGIAAGQAVRGAVRAFFTYRGAFFWKMQAGMGDVVFAPLYEVLRRRGVKFEFFHRLENMGLAAARKGNRRYVETLKFAVQARTRNGKPYQPLVDVRGLPCWPAQADFSQLADGARLKREGWNFESHWDERNVGTKTLQVGNDFDLVVLSVGIGAVPLVCRELIETDARWREMAAKVKSVPTQALQLWLRESTQELGWKGPSVNVSGYVEPFDTWADMPQLIREESFPTKVGAIAYYCSVLPDGTARAMQSPDYPAQRLREVRQNSIDFLNRDVHGFWPKAVDQLGRFRWDLLVASDGRASSTADESSIDTQYFRANVEPTDRYCLSLPGTLAARISPLDQTYDNLTVAGDWTDSGFNEGCVEAAVMSGRLAAHSLSLSPALEEIVGFDHP
jgi:uncharacterized protein with NAD-binding domain and iron-sulfur cluster